MIKSCGVKGITQVLFVTVLILSLCLPACMPKIPGISQMKPEYYPKCYQPFADLEAAQNELIKRTLIGASIGAVSGAVIGGIKKGAKGAVAGAAIGLAAGGVLGYGFGKMKQIQDDRERMRSYQADMNADMRNASRVEQYAMASMQCYTREFNALLLQYKNGSISKAEVEARYKEIRQGLTYISEILSDSKNELVKRDSEYREAFEAEAKEKKRKPRKVTSLKNKRERAAKKRPSAEISGSGRKELRQLSAVQGSRKKQAEGRALKIEQQEKIQADAAAKGKGTSNINNVSKYYEGQYLDSIVSMEEAESVNQRTLAAMSAAAQHAGIDMV